MHHPPPTEGIFGLRNDGVNLASCRRVRPLRSRMPTPGKRIRLYRFRASGVFIGVSAFDHARVFVGPDSDRGIFLTPLMLIMGWASPRQAAGVSAFFILLNSSAGLLGNLSSTSNLPSSLPWLLAAAALGGIIGSHLGSCKLADSGIKRFLSAVLFTAGVKMLLA